jgi:hypothetical protein
MASAKGVSMRDERLETRAVGDGGLQTPALARRE